MIESLETTIYSESSCNGDAYRRELPRIWRSPDSSFGHDSNESDEETVTANAVYTDEVLAGIAADGFNAIWVHGIQHHLIPSPDFPEFAPHSALHLGNMRALIERAAYHGLRVYLYMQPPRGRDARDPFWLAHPEVVGSSVEWQTDRGEDTTFVEMCTSVPEVKNYIREASAQLMRELEGLGGVILITASEYPSHCYGRFNNTCPRCALRTPGNVISEVISLVRDGVRSVDAEAHVIAWNWSWVYLGEETSDEIIGNLPDDVVLMADFERGDSKIILGKSRVIDEYSLSFIGPSQRFMDCYAQARERGLRIIAKLQLGTTHELATVANLPLLGNLHGKAERLRELGVEGYMGCWNFGNMRSANRTGFNTFFNAETLAPRDEALESFATSYFPGCDAVGVANAWKQFAVAMDSNYPFSIPFTYMGPVNYTLCYPLKPAPLSDSTAGRSWLNDVRGDRLDECLNDPYTLDEIIQGMENVARLWKPGVEQLEAALEGVSDEHAQQELGNAWTCYHVWQSTAHTFRVYRLREEWDDSKLGEFKEIAKAELENLQSVLPYIENDKRLGYHSEAHAYLFDAESIRGKIADLRGYLGLS